MTKYIMSGHLNEAVYCKTMYMSLTNQKGTYAYGHMILLRLPMDSVKLGNQFDGTR